VRLIYCCDPIKPARVDEAFAAEENAARATGFERSLVDYEALVAGDAAAAVRRVVAGEELAMYRGWMLPPVRYTALHDALASRGVRLINDPGQYQYAHFFPESYPDLVGFTPESICIPTDELDWAQLAGRLASFGDRPLVVKDWVKSRKHEWDEACFIPSATDAATVERVARRFIALQADDLTGGLVLRLRAVRAAGPARTKRHAAHEGVPHLLSRRQSTILRTLLAGRGVRRASRAA
jgi:hypothetical protein